MRTHRIKTPFGSKYYVNADITASGIPEETIEQYIKTNIEPYYANTHSNNHNGKLMAHYIEESKNIIRKSIHTLEDDRVIFTGNGCTGAVRHLIHSLGLYKEHTENVSIFMSVLEHHSNYLPWKHVPCELVIIPVVMDTGIIDLKILEEELNKRKHTRNICSFTACSNVTGVIQPVYDIAKLVHSCGGFIFFDFAASAPYVPINMHKDDISFFDAIYISTHKFVGGVGTPGILVANKRLFMNNEPFYPGGGTTVFDYSNNLRYCDNIETRESGGTPNIIGSIKAGLVFDLKCNKLRYIRMRNREINRMVHAKLESIQGIIVLNPSSGLNINQLPIYSIVIKPYHYNLVTILFNDLFGIQVRGGISCCSLYAQQVKKNNTICSLTHCGWVRITFHYLMSNDVVNYILTAIRYIAKNIHMLVRNYQYNKDDNTWSFIGYKKFLPKLKCSEDGHFLLKNAKVILTKRILHEQLADIGIIYM